jgi:hypothetical protein
MRQQCRFAAKGVHALALVALLGVPSARADKTDIVQMSNGDRLVCEVRELEHGRLRVKTDGLGTVYAEWDKAVRLESVKRFEVQPTTGARVFGTLKSSVLEKRLVVGTDAGDVEIEFSKVSHIQLIRSSFWDRFDGALDIGGSYTQADKLLQLNPAFNATYVERAFLAGIDLSATWTRQEGKEDTSRGIASLSYLRLRGERWFAFGRGSGERNTELGLDVRVLASGGVGRFLAITTHSRLQMGGGLTASREVPLEGEATSQLEGLFTAQWNVFSYGFPETHVSAVFSLYPGITNGGRLRGDLNVQVRREIFRDFTIGLSLYDSFDNQPATEGAEQNDWGATISVGWTF